MDLESIDHVLTTTRAVRRRLDLSREVPREVIVDCIRISQQAPTGSDMQGWRWIVVTDPEVKAKLADIYRDGGSDYFADAAKLAAESGSAKVQRIYESAQFLSANLHNVPALVVPCIKGRIEGQSNAWASGFYGSIFPAVWSFMLAARSRGLGSSLTTVHLFKEADAAELLGIPADVTQVGLVPLAYFTGDDFKPAARPPAEWITSWDRWGNKG
ncbi:MAG: nitroreductase family protein [Acidimicrobiia bacterium]